MAVPDKATVRIAVREAHREAAPFALGGAAGLVGLAAIGKHADWLLLDHRLWWLWLIVAAPYIALAFTLFLGLDLLVEHDRRRETVIALLAVVWMCNVGGIAVLVVSLVASSGSHITGRQLLLSGFTVLITDVIVFGLAYWELDSGGPIARALATARHAPDFQFPQDENPQLARDDWTPRLWDYLYMSLTNSIAFSPTDAMPLTRPAKALMAAESTLSAVTVLLVAARAVNILQ
jgi:uncharacterized membrane protein